VSYFHEVVTTVKQLIDINNRGLIRAIVSTDFAARTQQNTAAFLPLM
jgi:hypothetical protein